MHSSGRHHPFLGANPEWFARLLAGQVYLGTLLGGNPLTVQLSTATLACIAVAGTMILILAATSAPIGMRSLLYFSCLLFVAALASPITFPPPGSSAWKMLAICSGARYWFPLSLAFAWSLAYCARSRALVVRLAAICLFVVMSVGFVRDFRYPAFTDLKPNYAQDVARIPRGATIIIPINPAGWDMQLVRH